jgi:SAM-dependent methyltransferase
MHADVVDLREFYHNPLGHVAQRLLRQRIRGIWPTIRNETLLTVGFGTPFLRPMLDEAKAVLAMMPAPQGVAYWPREGPNISCLVDTSNLPLPDSSVDRVILIHALDGAADPQSMLNEVWRVIKSNGRLLVIVPNRRGIWTHSDRTPFGTGQPYSASQIRGSLRNHGFLIDRDWPALYVPPTTSRLVLSLADVMEKYGEKLFPSFGGVLLVEASKQLYAPIEAKNRSVPRRLVLPSLPPLPPLPLPEGPEPFPTG